MMNIDFDSFSPFWILFDASHLVISKSTFFAGIQQGQTLEELIPDESFLIQRDRTNIYQSLKNKIVTLCYEKQNIRFRGTVHKLQEKMLLICWPAFNKLEDIKSNNLNNQMLHPACYLMDTLIIKDVLSKTQKKSRDNFLKKVEAEQLKKVSEEFLANMSHEIRTPLNGLLGMIQLLNDDSLSTEQLKLLDIMESSGQSLLKVLNDILDYSKINSGKVELENINFNLKELLESAIGLLSYSANQKNIKLYLEAPSDLDLNFVGDPLRIRQIITNFISNSLKFTEVGEIQVSAEIKELASDECYIKVNVKDTGIGIPKERQSKLFSAFVQADSSTTRKYGGTGLGLSITSKLAKLMQGSVGADSQEGKGAHFFFEVKLGKAKDVAIVKELEIESDNKNFDADVLVVEDNKVNQKVVELMLKKLGVNCTLVSSGAQAMSALKSKQFSLILMDMQLPEMSGVDVTKSIIEKYTNEAPPIIALTANAFEDDRKKCFEAGMKDFLAKPLQKSELMRVLLNYLK